jgi:hypothetical protein
LDVHLQRQSTGLPDMGDPSMQLRTEQLVAELHTT